MEAFKEKYLLPSNYAWLIPNVDLTTLDDLARKGKYPTLDGLYIPAFFYSLAFGVVRYVLAALILKPLAIAAMKLPSTNFKFNPDIDGALRKLGKTKGLSDADIQFLQQSTGKTPGELSVYITKMRAEKLRNIKITKFVEASWRFIIYAFFTYFGTVTWIYPNIAEWILDTKQQFIGWPYQDIPDSLVLYHQLQVGCYLHQLVWTEVTRSDAIVTIIHHFTTILLITHAQVIRFYRLGAITAYIHDLSDIFLESAKCFNYASKVPGRKWASTISDILFGIFAISFYTLRLYFFPKLSIYSLAVDSVEILGMWPGYWVSVGFFGVLLCLHTFWSYLITRMIYKLLTTGIEKDERSDDEDEYDDVSLASPRSTKQENSAGRRYSTMKKGE